MVIRGCYCSESVGAQVTCVCEDVAQICSWLRGESQDICQQALIKLRNNGDLVRSNVLSVLPHLNRQSTQPDPKRWKITAEIIHVEVVGALSASSIIHIHSVSLAGKAPSNPN